MAMRETNKQSTGIYTRVTKTADDTVSMHELLQSMANRQSITWQLEQIEPDVRAVLAGYADADPIAEDAREATRHIVRLKAALAGADAPGAASAALQLGFTIERMGVRPFERSVASDRAMQVGRQKGGETSNAHIQDVHTEWERLAEEARAENPYLSRRRIAEVVAKRTSMNPATGRRYTWRPIFNHLKPPSK